jgi:hypothetical protein
VAILFLPPKHGDTKLHQKALQRRLSRVFVFWCLCDYSLFATKARRHKISPKGPTKIVLVGFRVLVFLWLIFFCHQSTETQNCTKRPYKEGFREFSCFGVYVTILYLPPKHGDTKLHQKVLQRLF